MTLQKFNIPVEIIDLIATLEPENQGIIYSHLFAYIYHGTPVPDSLDPRCRLILRMIVERIDGRVRRARAAQERAAVRKAAAAAAVPAEPVEKEADEVSRRIIDNVEKSHRPLGTVAQALYEARLRKSRQSAPAAKGVGDGRGQKSRAMI